MQIFKEEEFFAQPAGFDAVLLWQNHKAMLIAYRNSDPGPGAVYEWSGQPDQMEIINLLDHLKPESLRVVTAFPKFSLMPAEVLAEPDNRNWHDQLPGKGFEGLTWTDEKKDLGISVTFGLPAGDFEFLSSLSENQNVEHLAGVVLENMEGAEFSSIWSKIVLYFTDNQMLVVAQKHSKTALVNSFSYQLAADALYYLLWVKKELFANEEDVPVFVNGMVKPGSNLHNTLKNYIKPLYFGTSMRRDADDLSKDFPGHTFQLLRNRKR